MAKTLGYLRVSTVRQDLDNQKLEILTYAEKNNLKVDDLVKNENHPGRMPRIGESRSFYPACGKVIL